MTKKWEPSEWASWDPDGAVKARRVLEADGRVFDGTGQFIQGPEIELGPFTEYRIISTTNPPLALGMYVHPYGTIDMVGSLSGERYYWLTDRVPGKIPAVSMISAFMLEPMARDPKAEQAIIDAGQSNQLFGMARYNESWQQGLMGAE